MPLHFLKQGARAIQSVGICLRLSGGDDRSYRCSDEKVFGFCEAPRPLYLSVVGQQLCQHDACECGYLSPLGFDIDRLDCDQLVTVEWQYDQVAADHLRAVLVPERQIS